MTETIAGLPIVHPLPENLQLASGGHNGPEDGFCIMEAVAFLVGEKWSDAPSCVSPVIRRFAIALNDRWSDADRQLLVPYISKVIGTTRTESDESARRCLAGEWGLRMALPATCRQWNNEATAARFEALAPIVDEPTLASGRALVWTIYEEMRERREAARAQLTKAAAAAVEVAVEEAVEVAEVEVEEVEVAVAVAVAVEVEVAVAVAVAVAVEVEVAVEVAVEVEVEVAVEEITRALAGSASSGSWAIPVAELIRTELAKLPKNADYFAIRSAIYWPVRRKMAEVYASGVFGPEYDAYRAAMRAGALDLLDRMIAVGQKVGE